MPNADTHFSLMAALTAAIGFTFNVPGAVIFAAFSGSLFALALSGQVGYWKGFLIVAGGTFGGGYLCSLVAVYLKANYGIVDLRGVAFFGVLIIIVFRVQIFNAGNSLIKSLGNLQIKSGS
jgi:hypothetical protein